jgi:hypothetical protein
MYLNLRYVNSIESTYAVRNNPLLYCIPFTHHYVVDIHTYYRQSELLQKPLDEDHIQFQIHEFKS